MGGISSLSLLCFAAQLLLSFSPSLFLSYPFCFQDSLDGLRTVPPFGIREPSKEYGDGRGPREDGKERFSSSSFSCRSSLSRALSPLSLFSPPSFLPFISKTALSAHIDALFLPGVAFDRQGRRLGRGLGYYDAWAHRARKAKREATEEGRRAKKSGSVRREVEEAEVEEEEESSGAGPLLVGLAFSQQLLTREDVPVEQHDVGLDAVVVAGEGVVATSERGRRALLLAL